MKTQYLLLLLSIALSAETTVSGFISQNEWWDIENSPYVITNDLVIGQDARLVIEPGVEILIEKPMELPEGIEQLSQTDSFSVSIRVLGALRCMGKPDNPIIFRGRYVNRSMEYSHWEGITFNSKRSDEIIMSYTHITQATSGLTVSNGTPLIRNVLFEKNNIGLSCNKGSSPRVVNALFTANFLAGTRIDSANPEIYNSIFYQNHNIGVWSDNVSRITFENNLLWENGDRDFSQCDPELGLLTKTNSNGDSTDYKLNLYMNPLYIGTVAELAEKEQLLTALHDRSLHEPSPYEVSLITDVPALSEGRIYYLSQFSPAINAGHSASRFLEPDGSAPDLGIWGGPEFLSFQ